MENIKLKTEELRSVAPLLRAGQRILLSGRVYTARDAAHKKIADLLAQHKSLPFELEGAVIYYAGPTQTPVNRCIGSCGPTTSSRMDVFTPLLLQAGLTGMIGKGERSAEVMQSITQNKAVYLCALGGAGALACRCITSCKVIAFEELGCESVKELMIEDFPLIVGVDCSGGNLFEIGRAKWAGKL